MKISAHTSINEALCAYLRRCSACQLPCYRTASFLWGSEVRGWLFVALNESWQNSAAKTTNPPPHWLTERERESLKWHKKRSVIKRPAQYWHVVCMSMRATMQRCSDSPWTQPAMNSRVGSLSGFKLNTFSFLVFWNSFIGSSVMLLTQHLSDISQDSSLGLCWLSAS